MSVMPASANTSASPSFAQQIPTAPAAICIFAMSMLLCVFACGLSATPASRARATIAAMLAASRSESIYANGVRRSASCMADRLSDSTAPFAPDLGI
jgi:ABC-type multidrug transport system permease subunit